MTGVIALALTLALAVATAFMMARAATTTGLPPLPPMKIGDKPERLLQIQVTYMDTARTRAFITIVPGQDITIAYETGAVFRVEQDELLWRDFDRRMRNIAGIPYPENVGHISISSHAAPGAGSGSSKRHEK